MPPAVYERHRLAVRTEPLLLVEGRLERHAQAGGAINVLVNRVDQIAAPGGLVAQVQDFSAADERVRAEEQAAAGGRCRRIPRRRAAGDELRCRSQALDDDSPCATCRSLAR